MISSLVIHPDITVRQSEIEQILKGLDLSQNHPNTLWFSQEEKLGIGESRKIQEFLSLKPYQGKNQAVVLLVAENLSLDAQNALLKTLEEAGDCVSLILGARSEDQLLPTIISRCKIINLQNTPTPEVGLVGQKYQEEIEKLLEANMEERFKFIEKLEDKENFLFTMTAYFRNQLINHIQPRGLDNNFLKDLLEAEKWAKQNVNIRAVLEYLMLLLPHNNES
ncbi:MAG: hypothetical protein Q7R97_00985 [Candidatus Daviesbacteria bacterium]|nr:hypothetical protein [Candidatus Daviesbacteria bacterium]